MEPKETYLKTVYKRLQGPRREKEVFLHGLRGDIEVFLEQNPDATYSDIESNFGNPEDMSQEFANGLEPQAAKCLLRMKKRFSFLIVTLAIVTALIIVGFMVVDYIEWKRFSNGYCSETIIVQTDYENLPERPEESTDMILVYK